MGLQRARAIARSTSDGVEERAKSANVENKPIVRLVIVKDLSASGDRYKGGTILDPEDGKVYKAELWVEDGKLKVRRYLGMFYRTQTWIPMK